MIRVSGSCVLILLLLLLAVQGCGSEEKPLTIQQKQENLESFDYMWETIRQKHWDPEFGGLDWPGIRDELRPRVEQAVTISEARQAMSELINRFEKSHYNLIPKEAYRALDPNKDGGRGITGIRARVFDGQAMVVHVDENSPADEAGVRPGWLILRIDNENVQEKLGIIADECEHKSWKEAMLANAVEGRLEGKVGSEKKVTFMDGADTEITIALKLTAKRGKPYKFGHLPDMFVWIDVDTLSEDIGYIAFNMFMDPVHLMPVFNDAIKSFSQAKGLIIDIRGNGGGMGAMAMGMAGWFIEDENEYIGTMSTRDTELKLIINPRTPAFTGPLVILVDCLSGSAAEFFSGGLQGLKRAHVIGQRTMGAALPSAIEKLPNGDGFQYAFGNYISSDGTVLEGRGVIPDIEVAPSRNLLLSGRDIVVEAALNWINEQSLNNLNNK